MRGSVCMVVKQQYQERNYFNLITEKFTNVKKSEKKDAESDEPHSVSFYVVKHI